MCQTRKLACPSCHACMESSLIGDRQIEDDLLLFNCIHHLIIQEYLKGMKTSSFRLELDAFRMLIGKYSKTEAPCHQPAGSAFKCLVTRSVPGLRDWRPEFSPRTALRCTILWICFPLLTMRALHWSLRFVLTLKFWFPLVKGLRKYEACSSDRFWTLSC